MESWAWTGRITNSIAAKSTTAEHAFFILTVLF